MLNPIQKNFRKQMRGLNLEDDGYSQIYRKPRKRPYKKAFNRSALLLLILAILIVGDRVYDDYRVSKHEKIQSYLQESGTLEKANGQIVASTIIGLNGKMITTEHIQSMLVEVELLSEQIEDLRVPKSFEQHKSIISESLNDSLELHKLIDMSFKTNTINNEQVNYYVNELNNKSQLIRSELIKGLKLEGLNYKILEDGTVEYEILKYFYQL